MRVAPLTLVLSLLSALAVADDRGPHDSGRGARAVSIRTALSGPFASIEILCREGVRRPGRCVMQPGGWTRKVAKLDARGAALGVQLLRVRENTMGEPVEYCRIAIGTREGWYVTAIRNEQRCRGGIVGMSTVETTASSLEWIEGTADPTFVLTTRRREERGENYQVGEGEYRHSTGVYDTERARFCSAPAGAPPRCSAEYIIGCNDLNHPKKWRTAAWSFENGSGAIALGRKVDCTAGRSLGEMVRD